MQLFLVEFIWFMSFNFRYKIERVDLERLTESVFKVGCECITSLWSEEIFISSCCQHSQ